MRIRKLLSPLRYLSAALFFCAVFYSTYRREPARAAYCDQTSRVIWEGPNPGTYSTQAECEEHWTNENHPAQDCASICGPGCTYNDGGMYDQCCSGTGGWEWNAGFIQCQCTEK